MPFAALGLPASLVRGVRAAGYSQPTPIQSRAIPLILTGRDLIGAAQTGTGKTAAFVLPMLARLLEGGERLRALVLTPTRELAAQVETNARDYARFTDLRVGVVFGGVPIGPQERMLRHEGVDLLVATPGRLLDLQGRQSVSLDDVEVLVLDEADRMVDMGFAPDLRRILKLLPTKRQTLMFSATMPPELNQVAKEALHDPRARRSRAAEPSGGGHHAGRLPGAAAPQDRAAATSSCASTETGSVIVFTRTKHGAARLARQLERRGHSVAALHGDRTQGQRERALDDLRRGRVQVLVATDIASRGIDVDDITHVINYDVPHTPEDYVHRIGRTGRIDAAGDAFTFMSPEEAKAIARSSASSVAPIPRVIAARLRLPREALAVPRWRRFGLVRRGEPRSRRSRRGSRRRWSQRRWRRWRWAPRALLRRRLRGRLAPGQRGGPAGPAGRRAGAGAVAARARLPRPRMDGAPRRPPRPVAGASASNPPRRRARL